MNSPALQESFELYFQHPESRRQRPASKITRDNSMTYVEKVEEEVSSWADVSVHPHRFGGREFRFRNAEIGHIHVGGIVDIPFQRAIHDVLLDEGLAEEHHWVPNSGWITYRVRSEHDFSHALWLMRLSYLRYAFKAAADPEKRFEEESEQLHLSPQLHSLLELFCRKSAKPFPIQPAPA